MPTSDSIKDLGGVRKVALGAPATLDQAGYDALTWVPIRGVVSWPEQGDEFEDVPVATLDDGRIEHSSGGVDGGVIDIPVVFSPSDAGQTIVQANIGNNQTISWQDVDEDGSARFFYGRVMASKRNEKTRTSYKGYTYKVGVNSPVFIGVENS